MEARIFWTSYQVSILLSTVGKQTLSLARSRHSRTNARLGLCKSVLIELSSFVGCNTRSCTEPESVALRTLNGSRGSIRK